jgi:hypothetical protein
MIASFNLGNSLVGRVTFLQPQWAQFRLHPLRPLLDVFSQETDLAPRKRGFFFVRGSVDATRES